MYCDLKSYGQTFVRLNWFIITAEPPETEHQLIMQRFSDDLREVDLYENQTTGIPAQKVPNTPA